jgi:hypothetical protein
LVSREEAKKQENKKNQIPPGEMTESKKPGKCGRGVKGYCF